jgi:hypothetical protein
MINLLSAKNKSTTSTFKNPPTKKLILKSFKKFKKNISIHYLLREIRVYNKLLLKLISENIEELKWLLAMLKIDLLSTVTLLVF